MMKRLIITADDLGLSRGINKGIFQAHRDGTLTSASLLVNMPGFEDAVDQIRQAPGLSVGVHINVVRGRPLRPASKTGSIFRGDVFEGSLNKLVTGCFGKRMRDDFERESRAQIEKALDAGMVISYVDSEKHVHMFPPFFRVLAGMVAEYGISRIRCVNETVCLMSALRHPFWPLHRQMAAIGLSWCGAMNRSVLRAFRLQSPDHFVGIRDTGRMTGPRLQSILSCLEEGTTEIMCHPGYIDEEWERPPLCREKYFINSAREEELSGLIDPALKVLIIRLGIDVVGYAGL